MTLFCRVMHVSSRHIELPDHTLFIHPHASSLRPSSLRALAREEALTDPAYPGVCAAVPELVKLACEITDAPVCWGDNNPEVGLP